MRERTIPLRELPRCRLFWLCAVALTQGVLFLIFPNLPASVDLFFGVVLVLLLAGVINKKDQPQPES